MGDHMTKYLNTYDLSDNIIDLCEFFAPEKLYYILYMYIYDIYFHQFHNIVNIKNHHLSICGDS